MRSGLLILPFAGKLAVVTGGGSGIGRALVMQLAREGCSVAACDVNEPALAEVVEAARAGATDDASVSGHICDVSDEEAFVRFRTEVVEQHNADHIDYLFNNAGVVGEGSFVSGDRAAWERVFDICWKSVYLGSRTFMPLLTASEEAVLVNMSSANGFWATHGPGVPSTAYSAAKFAVKGFSEALIEDLRTHAPHVRVAVVMPGNIATSIVSNSKGILGKDPVPGTPALVDPLRVRLRDIFVTPVEDAAAVILEGIRKREWRILVGPDVLQLDARVRAKPDAAYEPDGPALVDPDLVAGLMALAGRFAPAAAIQVEVELRLDRYRIVCSARDGKVEFRRGNAEAVDAVVKTDFRTFRALVEHVESIDAATQRGALEIDGPVETVAQLVASVR